MRYAIRQLIKSPGFTSVAILTLALCIGANLTIFAVLDAILVRSLPFPNPDRLVVLHNAHPASGVERGKATITNYFERRGAIKAFDSLSTFKEDTFIVGQASSTRPVAVGMITHEFFHTLGVPLAMGQTFTDAEFNYGSNNVAILTDGFWRHYFNADPDVIGRTFFMDSLSTEVIGVLPPGFRYLSSQVEIFRPNAHFPELRQLFSQFAPGDRMPDGRTPVGRHSVRSRRHNGQMVARLAENCSLAEAQAQVDALNAHLLSRDPLAETLRATGYRTWIEPLREDHIRSVKPVVIFVQSGALLILLLGVINLSGLLVIRASGRRREMAVRQALGAKRWQIAREICLETMILATAGGVLGASLGVLGIHLSLALGADALPLGADIAFDGRIALASVLITMIVGLAIALPLLGMHLLGSLNERLQGNSRTATLSRPIQRLRHGLIVAQIALACVLLYGAGLLGTSLKRTLEKSPGFAPDQVFSAEIALPWFNYRENSVVPFVYRLLDRLAAVPGVSHTAVSTGLPFTVQGSAPGSILVEGEIPSKGNARRAHYSSLVTAGYWDAMGISLLQGRLLQDADSAPGAQRVAVVDQALARQYWPQGNALGRRFSTDPSAFNEESAFTIVGIVNDVKQQDLSETARRGSVYLPYRSFPKFQVIVRAPATITTMASTLQRVVRELDPDLPISDFSSMQRRIDESLTTRRSPALLAGVFAAVALLLASIGAYGVLAYAVSQRRREIGVRMSLGATPTQIGCHFMSAGGRLLALGTIAGCLGAWITGQAMLSLLFEVSPFHLATAAETALTLCLATLLASLVPAMRAARVDPVAALQSD